ncbi:MAG: CcoQ/FixQ family Cbb3-type cytochrome c oxidase assembly chaperone [Hyphomicrobiales bacterium]|nr:cbb3-type cytochrome c oxidase subunit 3 [Hyphomicrobiales bacterium]PCH49940.1 MAG: CcoQ/FixQ family Cbb3-type cytochrome c oxidase assembly chaperone [Hyphomicrobiales bacterium]
MDYTLFRELADSWGLVYLFVLFVGAILFTFRPGSKKIAEEVSRIPFSEDE